MLVALCRNGSLVTATCYTVLGVANKMATVTANALIWDQHASTTGVLFLVLCLIGAATYQQAPLTKGAEGTGLDERTNPLGRTNGLRNLLCDGQSPQRPRRLGLHVRLHRMVLRR